MKLTGATIMVFGRKLYERTDGFYQDDTGLKYDYRGGKLYVERFAYGPKYPAVWSWIRPAPVAHSAEHDRILDEAEGF
jgi:hypothetical protein